MSLNAILVIVGALLILVGLAKAGQSGGFRLSNFGINFGGGARFSWRRAAFPGSAALASPASPWLMRCQIRGRPCRHRSDVIAHKAAAKRLLAEQCPH
jgi:hypothetical protein